MYQTWSMCNKLGRESHNRSAGWNSTARLPPYLILAGLINSQEPWLGSGIATLHSQHYLMSLQHTCTSK